MRIEQRLRLERRLINPVLRTVLRSPLHRVASGSLAAIEYEGQLSARRRNLIVAYSPGASGTLVVAAGDASRKRWWRNFCDARPLEITLGGRRRRAVARVLVDEAELAAARAAYVARFPRLAGALEPTADVRLVAVEVADT